ncbi:hypothetical protein L1049_012925 [Liquidambar formosana]|uniref:Uncharacterized protein n=1 Tax=Liquidambar formosana TaxID=63359 RepID=A0AAP0WTT8_LIQFO
MALQSRLRAVLERSHNSNPSINFSMQHENPQITLGAMQVPPPLHNHNAFDIEMQRYHQPSNGVSLGEAFMGLTFQATIGLMALFFQSSSQTKDDQPRLLPQHVVGVSMVIGFTASLIGILLRGAYPSMGRIMEMTGSFFATLGFFVMISMFLPTHFMWIGWLACGVSLLAYLVAFIK